MVCVWVLIWRCFGVVGLGCCELGSGLLLRLIVIVLLFCVLMVFEFLGCF